jgi:hypothetical protein
VSRDRHAIKPEPITVHVPQTGSCPICRIKFKADDISFAVKECGHSYHPGCLQKWIDFNGPHCPSTSCYRKIDGLGPHNAVPTTTLQSAMAAWKSKSETITTMVAAADPGPVQTLRVLQAQAAALKAIFPNLH